MVSQSCFPEIADTHPYSRQSAFNLMAITSNSCQQQTEYLIRFSANSDSTKSFENIIIKYMLDFCLFVNTLHLYLLHFTTRYMDI